MAMKKAEVFARVSNWRDYCWARFKNAYATKDYPSASVWESDSRRAQHDLAYLKRGTNWREFETGTYAYGTRTPWTFMYPAEISSPLPWDLVRR